MYTMYISIYLSVCLSLPCVSVYMHCLCCTSGEALTRVEASVTVCSNMSSSRKFKLFHRTRRSITLWVWNKGSVWSCVRRHSVKA